MEPERPIEKLLRAFAKKRRDDAGAPLEPHSATRRMLQGEVARQFPKPAAGGARFTRLLAGWRPQLAWAVPVLAVLCIVGVLTLFPTGNKSEGLIELAQNNPPPARQAPDGLKSLEAAREPAAMLASTDRIDQPTLAYAAAAAKKAGDGSLGLDAGALSFKENQASNVTLGGVPAGTSGLSLAVAEKDVRQGEAFVPGVPEDLSGVALARKSPVPAAETSTKAIIPSTLVAEGQLQARNEPAAPSIANAELPLQSGFSGGGGGGGGRGGRGGRAAAPALASRSLTAPARVAPAPGAPPPAEPVDRVAAYRIFSNQAQATSQAFVQNGLPGRYRNSVTPAVPNQILAEFQFEQSGNQLRVIDHDGSLYTGGFEMAADDNNSSAVTSQNGKELPKMESALGAKQIAASPASNTQNAQNLSFRVTGTNRTSNQQVIFTGNFVALTDTPGAIPQQNTAVGALNLDKAKMQQQSLPLVQNSVINGRAQIGANQQIEINAVPAAP